MYTQEISIEIKTDMNTIKFFKKLPSFGGVRGGFIILFIIHCSLLNAQSWPPQGMLGDGSQGNPYQITDSSHLRALADYVNADCLNSDSTRGKYYKLMNDIDLGGYANWIPIGFEANSICNFYFGGNFDGNGKVVQNLTIYRPMDKQIGLFGVAVNATIENLGIINCNVIGKENIGGLVGYIVSTSYLPPYSICSYITNCFVTGNISGSGPYNYIGGIVGYGGAISMTNCYFEGNNISRYSSNVGGLIGQAAYVTVHNCYATGNVQGIESVGGLIGSMTGGASGGEGGGNGSWIMSNCYATNSVKGVHYVGGLAGFIGYDYSVVIRNCVAANDMVIGENTASWYTPLPTTNRIVGYVYNIQGSVGVVFQNNYALNTMVVQGGNGITSGLNTEDGMSISIDSLRSFTFYNTGSNWYNNYAWNIYNPSGIWKICDKQDLPFLRWQGIDCYYDIIASAGDNGNISPSGTVSVLENTTQTFIFTPNSCYETDSLWIDGVYAADSIAVGSYTFNNVTKNHTIKVSFKKIEYFTPIVDTTCSNVPYTFGNQSVTSSGIYYDTLQNINGCDSVIELDLTVNPVRFTQISDSICEGDFYDFHGKLLSLADIYYDTLQTIHGCDSVIELTLIVNPTSFTPISDSIYIGNSYNFHGKLLSVSGIYYDTLQTIRGCDSIVELTLTVTGVGIVETHCNASLRVYPNPANGQLTIEYGSSACFGYAQQPTHTAQERPLSEVEVEIYDVVGQCVMTHNPPLTPLKGGIAPFNSPFEGGRGMSEKAPSLSERAGGKVIIDISHLASGMYFLKVNNQVVKFIKE